MTSREDASAERGVEGQERASEDGEREERRGRGLERDSGEDGGGVEDRGSTSLNRSSALSVDISERAHLHTHKHMHTYTRDMIL